MKQKNKPYIYYYNNGSCIIIENAKKVYISILENTTTKLIDSQIPLEYSNLENETITSNSCIFSKDNLTINGSSILNIKTNYLNGINIFN